MQCTKSNRTADYSMPIKQHQLFGQSGDGQYLGFYMCTYRWNHQGYHKTSTLFFDKNTHAKNEIRNMSLVFRYTQLLQLTVHNWKQKDVMQDSFSKI